MFLWGKIIIKYTEHIQAIRFYLDLSKYKCDTVVCNYGGVSTDCTKLIQKAAAGGDSTTSCIPSERPVIHFN